MANRSTIHSLATALFIFDHGTVAPITALYMAQPQRYPRLTTALNTALFMARPQHYLQPTTAVFTAAPTASVGHCSKHCPSCIAGPQTETSTGQCCRLHRHRCPSISANPADSQDFFCLQVLPWPTLLQANTAYDQHFLFVAKHCSCPTPLVANTVRGKRCADDQCRLCQHCLTPTLPPLTLFTANHCSWSPSPGQHYPRPTLL